MALTAEATALTIQQRQRQLALRAAILRELFGIWSAVDPSAIDRSWAALRPTILSLIETGRQGSLALARAYFSEFREAEGIAGVAPTIGEASQSWRTRALVSLEVTGPNALKNLVAVGRRDALEVALVRVSGVVARYTLEAGIDEILNLTREDEVAIGWARVTDGLPCAFCAMLASRGPAYKSRNTADFQAHDHCACTVEPVYHRGADWPGRSREFLSLWNDATKGVRGSKASLNAFRRVFETV